MYSTILLQSDTVLQQNLLSVIATGYKEQTEETLAPRPIGAVPTTLVHCKLVCAKENLGFVSRQMQEIFLSQKRLDLLLGTLKFLPNDTRAFPLGKAT